jgi:nicotinate-nucleotide adenylyltransferase
MASLIGLFGGTFEPPHVGHLILADDARAELALDRLMWVLTPDPPHKQGQPITPLAHRLAMVQRAIAGDAGFELSRLELDRPGPHFALDTVRLALEQNPGSEVVYLMGGDSLHDLPTWHRPAELVAACLFLGVMRRPEDGVDLDGLERIIPGVSAKVRFVNAPLVDIASHEIRRRVAAGLPYRHFLPDSIYNYIRENGLYR